MKLRNWLAALALSVLWMAGAAPAASILPTDLCEISSISVEGTNVVVTAEVAAQYHKVTLESKPRIGGTWEPRAVLRLEPGSTPVRQVTFRVVKTENMELLRLRGDLEDAVPASFFQGTNSFGVIADNGGIGTVLTPTAAPGGTDLESRAGAPSDSSRTVAESDIWNVSGDTLFFFNQYRGLQVIDVAKPDEPRVLGVYPMAAQGEQMYVVDGSKVILLAIGQCNWSGSSGSQIVLLNVQDGQPALATEVPVGGRITESRLVGTALYVVSEMYRQTILEPAKEGDRPQQVWEWGSQISSFDLANFNAPAARSSYWVPGYGNAIYATDRYLFVAAPKDGVNYWNGDSNVHVYDISNPNGEMARASVISATGRVKDKFKMNLDGNTLTLVTEQNNPVLKTKVETYSLENPASPQALGSLTVIEREQVYATRFDGKILYVVTFLRIDPLWVIDLSNPAKPQKVGELEIPGWSTYIYPWGNRLVTIGIDNTEGWRTAVQLFDVSDLAKPSLVKKVVLGEQYSSSEATSDEKAFGVLPEQGLILVPYSTWANDKSFQGVHLIDLERDDLRKRGSIEHSVEARRATWHRDRILSLSGTELLSVDATDRDKPLVKSTTVLSWSVDRVFVEGDYLVELGMPWNAEPALMVARSDSSSSVLRQLKLSNLPVLGAAVRDQKLYLAQGTSSQLIWPSVFNETNYVPVKTNEATLKVSIYDLSRLPEVALLGATEKTFSDAWRNWSQFEAVWPKPGVLVWSSSQGGYWGPIFIRGGAVAGAGIAIDLARPGLWWGGSSDRELIAYDVNEASAPAFASSVTLKGTNSWWDFSKTFTVDGLIYASRQSSEYDPNLRHPPYVTSHWEGSKLVVVTNEAPLGTWVQRSYLDVVNYSNPAEPSVRKPVNIPGKLVGLSHHGAVLYTQDSRYSDPVKWQGWGEWLEASAYDGVEARLVTSARLPEVWPHPVLADSGSIFVGQPGDGNAGASIETWKLSDAGKFEVIGKTGVKAAVNNFKSIGGLLAAQGGEAIDLFDAANPASLRLLGTGYAGCYGYNMEHADGSVEDGLWLPLGVFGAAHIGAGD